MINYIIDSNKNINIDKEDEYLINIISDTKLTINVYSKCKILFLYQKSFDLKEDIKLNIEIGEEILIGTFNYKDTSIENYTEINLNKPFSRVIYSNISLVNKTLEYKVNIIHNNISTYGEMVNYAVMNDYSTYNMKASGIINENMNQSISHQTTRVLTLTENYNCSCEPILIINDNDVQASHANSIGQADDDELYYLASRGLDKKTALHLISKAYLKPILSVFKEGELYNIIEKVIEDEIHFRD